MSGREARQLANQHCHGARLRWATLTARGAERRRTLSLILSQWRWIIFILAEIGMVPGLAALRRHVRCREDGHAILHLDRSRPPLGRPFRLRFEGPGSTADLEHAVHIVLAATRPRFREPPRKAGVGTIRVPELKHSQPDGEIVPKQPSSIVPTGARQKAVRGPEEIPMATRPIRCSAGQSRRRLSVALVSVLLSGCTVWEKPGATEAMRDIAMARCESVSRSEVPRNIVREVTPGYMRPAREVCEKRHGKRECHHEDQTWVEQRVSEQDLNDGQRSRVFAFCMRADGWVAR